MWIYVYPNNTETEITNAYIGIPFPESITLDKSSISLTTVWQTEQLTATLTPTPCDQSVTWSSDDTTIATVSTTGLVTCVTPWECTITATTVNNLTATCSVETGWTPWANTVAYYPLNSTSTVNDMSGNNKTMTNEWMTFWTYAWVDCWNSKTGYLERGSCIFTGTWEFTLNVWLYRDYDSWGYENAIMIGQWWGDASLWVWVYNDTVYTFWWNGDHNSGYTMNTGQWYNVVVTRTGNTGTIYVNWVSRWSGSVSFNPTTWATNIGSWFWGWSKRPGYMSEYIMEDKCWSSTEVADYFNQAKSLYGVS